MSASRSAASGRARMQEHVATWGHRSSGERLCRITAVLLGLTPLRHIACGPALVHIALHEPRDRGDVRVPGPPGLGTVTVTTGREDELPRARAIPLGLGDHWWIVVRAAVRDELDR